MMTGMYMSMQMHENTEEAVVAVLVAAGMPPDRRVDDPEGGRVLYVFGDSKLPGGGSWRWVGILLPTETPGHVILHLHEQGSPPTLRSMALTELEGACGSMRVFLAGRPVGWTLETALVYIRELQPRAMAAGWCVLLGGGVLNRGVSANDLDILFYPRTQAACRADMLEILPRGRWDHLPVGDVYSYTLPTGQRVEGIFQTHVPATTTTTP